MATVKEFIKTRVQTIAISAMTTFIEVCLVGGSRSGKTFIAIYAIIVRAVKHNNTNHLIVRRNFAHIKSSVWAQTLPQVKSKAFPLLKWIENLSDLYITLPNGSKIICAGTDDKDRIEKLLGAEYATIYMNETSQQPYSTYEVLKTRLNPPEGVKPLFILDLNPTNKRHWVYELFFLKINPETKQPLAHQERYTVVQMNPKDNIANLSDGYIDTLESMSEAKRKRFLEGEFSDDNKDALWKTEWITNNRIDTLPTNIDTCIVAVDPNVTDDKNATKSTDEAGIITCGRYTIDGEKHYVVISDDSVAGMTWGKASVDAYHKYQADKIIAEVNQGGDLVEAHIRNYDRSIVYDDVRATRGKELRAEPVADLYRRGYVHHYGVFEDLETELVEWVPGQGRSPNRLDALVWAISYMSKETERQYAEIIRY